MMRLLPLLFLMLLSLAQAREAQPLAQDEAVDKRLYDIASELRCLVCQNESLAASHADLANDLRAEIREMIRQGKTDQEIMDFMVARYSNFVRYRPPLDAETVLLWFGPFVLLAGATTGLVRYLRARNRQLEAAASLGADKPQTPVSTDKAGTP